MFFFSSRRRHTRYWRDWSSDVCSSDLGGEQHVLGRRAEGLDGHHGLVLLAPGVRVYVEVLEVQREQNEHRRFEQAPARAFEAPLDDLRALAVQLQITPPLLTHRLRETLLGLPLRDHGEAPRLPAVRRRGPASGLEHHVHAILRDLLADIPPHRATAASGVENGRLPAGGYVERSPGCDPLGPDGDDRVLLYPHPLVLVVFAAQEPHGVSVLPGARLQKPSLPADHDEGQEAPVLGVTVGDEGDARVLEDVSHPLEARRRDTLGLLVEGDVDPAGGTGVADRHDVRLPRPVGGREAPDAPPHEEGDLLPAQYLGGGLHAFTASRTLGTTSEAKRRMLSSACSWVMPGSRPQKQKWSRSEEHTSELQSRQYLVCRLLLEKKNTYKLTMLPAIRIHARHDTDHP